MNISKKSLFKLFVIATIVFLTLCCLSIGALAAVTDNTDTEIKNVAITPNYANLKDNNETTVATVNTLNIKSETPIDSIYIKFRNTTPDISVQAGDKAADLTTHYLNQYYKLPSEISGANEITINFGANTVISDVYAFSEGELPQWVQLWEEPYTKADLLLFVSHPGDENTFHAGILPYYSTVKEYRVQIVTFVDHTGMAPTRTQEFLSSLWDSGITHYPVLNSYDYAYATKYDTAINVLKNQNVTEENVYEFQTEMIRRFKPLVIIGPALKANTVSVGYQGLVLVNANTLAKAVEFASDPTKYPSSTEKYGTWAPKKVYFHLYEENKITVDWDKTYTELDGKSPFTVSQSSLQYYKSNPKANTITRFLAPTTMASQIKTISPCEYGLYFTTVGDDVNKNDLFENVLSYGEQDKLEQERLEEEKRKEEAEESKRVEESLKAESESESIKAAEESKKRESERLAAKRAAEASDPGVTVVIAVIVFIAAVAALAMVLIKKLR